MVAFLSYLEVGYLCIDVNVYAAVPLEAHLFESESKLMFGLIIFKQSA